MSFNNDVEMGDAGMEESANQGVVSMMSNFASNPNAYTIDALFPSNSVTSGGLENNNIAKVEVSDKTNLNMNDSGDGHQKSKRKTRFKKNTDKQGTEPDSDASMSGHGDWHSMDYEAVESEMKAALPRRVVDPQKKQRKLERNLRNKSEKPLDYKKKKKLEKRLARAVKEQNITTDANPTSAEPIVSYVRPEMITPESADLNTVTEYLQKAKNDVDRLRTALTKHTKMRRNWREGSVDNGTRAKPAVLGKQTRSAIGKTKKPIKPRVGKHPGQRDERMTQRTSEKANHEEEEDQEMELSATRTQVQSSATTTQVLQDENMATTIGQFQAPGHNFGQGKPGKSAYRTLVRHLNGNVFDEKTLDAVKDVSALDNGNNNMQAIRVLRRNLENILYTFGEQSDQYQNFKFMVEESIAELETKMKAPLKYLDARDAAKEAKRAAGVANNTEKEVLRATRRALVEARRHEQLAIQTLLENGNNEQRAVAEARLGVLKAELNSPEKVAQKQAKAARKRARMQQKKEIAAAAEQQDDGGGVALPPGTMDEGVDKSNAMFGMQALGGHDEDIDSEDSNTSGGDTNEDDEDDTQPGGVALMQDDMEKLNALRALLGDMQIQPGRA